VTNNEKLKAVMAQTGLTAPDIAKMLKVSVFTVIAWRRNPKHDAYRGMPDDRLAELMEKLS
jgi:transposase